MAYNYTIKVFDYCKFKEIIERIDYESGILKVDDLENIIKLSSNYYYYYNDGIKGVTKSLQSSFIQLLQNKIELKDYQFICSILSFKERILDKNCPFQIFMTLENTRNVIIGEYDDDIIDKLVHYDLVDLIIIEARKINIEVYSNRYGLINMIEENISLQCLYNENHIELKNIEYLDSFKNMKNDDKLLITTIYSNKKQFRSNTDEYLTDYTVSTMIAIKKIFGKVVIIYGSRYWIFLSKNPNVCIEVPYEDTFILNRKLIHLNEIFEVDLLINKYSLSSRDFVHSLMY